MSAEAEGVTAYARGYDLGKQDSEQAIQSLRVEVDMLRQSVRDMRFEMERMKTQQQSHTHLLVDSAGSANRTTGPQ